MNFEQWYKKAYGNDWADDFAQVGSFIWIVRDEYTDYCAEKGIEPVFTGCPLLQITG